MILLDQNISFCFLYIHVNNEREIFRIVLALDSFGIDQVHIQSNPFFII